MASHGKATLFLCCAQLTQEGGKVAFPKECGSFWVILALKILSYRYHCMKKNSLLSDWRVSACACCPWCSVFISQLDDSEFVFGAVHMRKVSCCCCRTRTLDPWKLKELNCFQICLFVLIKYLGAGPAGRHLGIIRASDTPREPEPWWALYTQKSWKRKEPFHRKWIFRASWRTWCSRSLL